MKRRLRHLIIIAAMTLIAGNAYSQTDPQFVIMYDNHYLAHVYNGETWTLQDATTFSPNCIWYSSNNYNYYFNDGVNLRYLSAPLQREGALSLSDSYPGTQVLSNVTLNYYFYDWWSGTGQVNRGLARGLQHPLEDCDDIYNSPGSQCWEVVWVSYEDDQWKMSSTYGYNPTTYAARFYAVTVTEHGQEILSEEGGAGNLTLSNTEMDYPSNQSLSITASNYSYTYIPAYTTYVFNGGTHNYYGNTDNGTNTPISQTSTGNTVSSYHWTISGEGAEFLTLSNDHIYNPTLTYSTENTTGHKSATITVTVTYSNGATQTRSAEVLVKTRCQNPTKAAEPIVTYEDVTVSWVHTSDHYKVYWKKHSESSYNNSIELYDVNSYTITGLAHETRYDYKVSAFCGGDEITSPAPTEYSFTTGKEPHALLYGSVFGGGRMANVTGKTEVVIIDCDSIGAVYGGNDIAGSVQGADGSIITLGVNAGDTYATAYNNGRVSSKVRIGDVYGGGNGYYAYNGTSFVPAAYDTEYEVANNASIVAFSPSHPEGQAVWTNNTGSTKTLTPPAISKTNIIVTNDFVKVDSLFGGAKNANLSATSNDVSITINGGTLFAVFCGNNYGGSMGYRSNEHIVVNATKTNLTPNIASTATTGYGRDFGIRYLFGGGNKVTGNTVVIDILGGQCDTIFGGGNSADLSSTTINVNCSLANDQGGYTFGNTYSNAITSSDGTNLNLKNDYEWNGTGLYNVHTLFGGNNQATMEGVPNINLTSGSVGTVYGGGNAGDMVAQATDNGNGGSLTINGNSVKYGTHVVLNSPSVVVDNIYGGCQVSNVHYSTWVEIKDGHVGTVYGGCNVSGDVGSTRINLDAAPTLVNDDPNPAYQVVYGGTYVVATGGTVHKNLFAGGNGYYHCVNANGYYTNALDYDDPQGHYIGFSAPTHNETHVIVNTGATIEGNVYAGGNLACVGFDNNTVGNNPYPKFVGLSSVRMSGGTVNGNVFGGGNMANVYGSNEIQVSGGTIAGSLYGGNDRTGKVAQISNRVLPAEYNTASDEITSLLEPKVYTYVSLTGNPTITNVYGGGNGYYEYFDNFTDAQSYSGPKEVVVTCDIDNPPIQRSTFVDVAIDGGENGGHINNVYGGGDGVTVTEFLKVFFNVQGATNVSNVETIFGGNNKGDLALVPDIVLLNGQVNTVYGGCNQGAMTATGRTIGGYTGIGSYVRLLNEYDGDGNGGNDPVTPNVKVMDAVYGGCRLNGVTNNTLVLVEGGNHSNVKLFGGSDISGTVSGFARVAVTGGTVGNVYGGGNGNYTYDGGTVSTIGESPVVVATGVSNAPICAQSGVDIVGGQVGSSGGTSNLRDVFGGGYGAGTSTTGNVVVNFGTVGTASATPTIYGNVYGGSALGNVNTNASNSTTVNILNGTLNGDIFGGGLGDDTHAPLVNGVVHVNIGADQSGTGVGSATINGRIFGCNNANGTPKSNVFVDIYSTKHTSANSYPTDVDDLDELEANSLTQQYAIKAVYGGGNLADYSPLLGTDKSQVHIHYCDVNTVDTVYGGGNAADATNTKVLIDGGRIRRVFGGGNGFSATDNHTDPNAPEYNPGANITGTATTEITGGLIDQVFGGSNQYGTIGNIDLNIVKDGTCLELINEVFSGNNQAPLYGDIVTNLVGECYQAGDEPDGNYYYGGTNLAPVYGNVTLNVYGGYYINVFGGSKGYVDPNNSANNISADIKRFPTLEEVTNHPDDYSIELKNYLATHTDAYGTGGNVTLNIYGGKIVNAFGGSDVLGDIEGKIEVNVIDSDDPTVCPLDLDNVYGGGNETEYDPITAIVGANRLVPEVNIKKGTVNHAVFGGGLGVGAIVTANPVVTVGDVASGHESYTAIVGNVATQYGNVYGGGELAQVHGNTKVVIQKSNTTVIGTVYGGGKGKDLENLSTSTDPTSPNYHPLDDRDAGLVKGNTEVDMRGGNVQRSIYGGGELGSVGTFTAYYTAGESPLHVAGEPKTCAIGTGVAKVLISGGRVGMNTEPNGLMPSPDEPVTLDDYGYVFCASKGAVDSIQYPTVNLLAIVDSTYLQISGSGVVTASIYGGSENGQVISGTYVKVTGGQIGLGHYKDNNGQHHWDAPYTDETVWTNVINKVKAGTYTDADAAGFNVCDAWPFKEEGQRFVYDHYATHLGPDGQYYYDAAHTQSSYGGSHDAGDGHSFFGHVFGGGSGYYPIAPDPEHSRPRPIWRRSAGRVCGNTYVEITGGHILTNVYGGNEITDVLGHSKVVMSGGTLGVPRTLDSILARPVNCYLFGAGMGDPRIMFNKCGNVGSSEVIVNGNAVIFGSVFGGGEDGHVLGNATTTITGNAVVGTFGTSSVDGNAFGGGRGFSARSLAAGVICGNVELNISGNALILGSVFGGGRMAAVGTYLADTDSENYGEMQLGNEHGNVTITITGGTIGNANQISHGVYSIGDVFGGSKGTLMDDWAKSQKLGLVKNTTVSISQASSESPTHIFGNVYGGGEIASVGSYTYATAAQASTYNTTHPTEPMTEGDVFELKDDNTGIATIIITGGVIGRPDLDFRKGHVFGGCLGRAGLPYSGYSFVNRSIVTLSNGTVYGSVFGGGENGHILDSTQVNISGGSIGIPLHNLASPTDNTIYRGNVYGGGRGIDKTQTGTYSITAGKVSGNTNVHITGGQIYRNVYGGGSLASVGDPDEVAQPDGSFLTGLATVTVTGGMIGTDGGYFNSGYYNNQPFNHLLENGHVFGSGRGVAGEAGSDYIHLAYVKDSEVTIGGTAYVTGSVFGSGENGHVRKDTKVTIEAGTGTFETETHVSTGEPYPIIGYPLTTTEMQEDVNTPILVYRGNVYGGGRGIDHTTQTNALSYTAGVVERNTYVIINGGTIRHNVYGGGSLARVGDPNETPQADGHFLTGHANITINGGQIGMSETAVNRLYGVNGNQYSGLNNGQVYGSGRGVAGAIYAQLAFVKYSHINFNGGVAVGSVFGGGENGHVRKDTEVNINGGTIGIADYNIASEVFRGNVYGGGRGIDHDETNHNINKTEGTVLGNTNIHITGGTIYHNVYGGGSLASVGTITYDANNQVTAIAEGTGDATIIIDQADGKTTLIGLDGNNNGRVFGSGRGYPGIEEITVGGITLTIDYSNLTYVNNTDITFNNGTIKGSIFGSGDNGHTFGDTRVVMNGGFLGNAAETNTSNHIEDGNIFGGGRGSDRYGNGRISPTAGHVGGNTYVEFNGGKILHNIYGGGHMASVGNYTTNNAGVITDWISGGDATIVINGTPDANGYNQIGIDGNRNGNVFGAGRGMAGNDAYGNDYTHLTYINNSYVHIHNGATIQGNVYGSGDNGHTYNDTHVNMNGGTIGTDGSVDNGNIFGGGRGLDTYGSGQLSITAGKTYGNTHVTVTGGTIKANIYGGGNMSSVVDTTFVTVGGNATVGISDYEAGGKVYGASRGDDTKPDYAVVNNTMVDIHGADSHIQNNIYGGGEKGAVVTNTNVTIADATLKDVYGAGEGVADAEGASANIGGSTTVIINSGTINNVYGGGQNGTVRYSTASTVDTELASTVTMNGGTVNSYVFGGGDLGTTQGQIIVNMNGGTIKDELFGGAKGTRDKVYVAGLKTVNVRGGTVFNHVYGGSRNANDGLLLTASTSTTPNASDYNAFVNVSGGLLRGDVYGAGYYGIMFGSSDVNIGKEAIDNANIHNVNKGVHVPAYLHIIKSVFAGSNWGEYNPAVPFGSSTTTGHSNIYLDGKGYDTQTITPPSNTYISTYMEIGGSLYGSGTSSDAGTQGRKIQIANFGYDITANQTLSDFDGYNSQNFTVLNASTRNMQSIQRCDTLIIDNSSIKFTGQGDISQNYNTVEYALVYIDKFVNVRNGSNIVTNVQIDEIRSIKSEYRPETVNGNPNGIYTKNPTAYWIGIGDTDYSYYYINGNTPTSLPSDTLINTIRFNGGYSMYVRYSNTYVNGQLQDTTETFGRLQGFFRMVSENGNETFAFARPKITETNDSNPNLGDGGFMSYYNEGHNNYSELNHSHPGDAYTRGEQFPYENVLQSRSDRPDYRYWRIRGTNEGNLMVSPMAFFLYSNPDSDKDFITIERTITLPPLECGGNSYYVLSDMDYGDHVHLVDVAIDKPNDNDSCWIVQYGTTYQPRFYGSAGPANTEGNYYNQYNTATADIIAHPNTYFGLVLEPSGSLTTIPTNHEYLLSMTTREMLSEGDEGNNYNPARFDYPSDPNGKMAKLTIRLTYYKEMTMSMALTPVTVQLKSYCVPDPTNPTNRRLQDVISIPIYVTTQTALGQDMTTTSYAMFGDISSGNNPETYNVKATMPPFIPLGVDVPFYVYGVEYDHNDAPGSAGSGSELEPDFDDQNTSFDANDYHYAMTFKRGFNSDNKSGWREAIDAAQINYFQKPSPSSTEPFTPILLGTTDGRNPSSIDFTLYYNSCKPASPRYTENKIIGTLTYHICYPIAAEDVDLIPDVNDSTNWAKFAHFDIHIDLYKKEHSTGFYLDGIYGDNTYSGEYANYGKRTLQGVIDNNWTPGDIVWVVRPISNVPSVTWTSNDGAPIVMKRYPGKFVDRDHYSIDEVDNAGDHSFYYKHGINSPVANTGVYLQDTITPTSGNIEDDQAIFANITTKSHLVINNIILDGYNDDTHPQVRPLISVSGGGTVTIRNSSELRNSNVHPVSVLGSDVAMHLDDSKGGAMYIGEDGSVILLDGVNIHHNVITNSSGNGAAIYLDNGGTLTVGGLVTISDNTVNGEANNVYLYVEDDNSNIYDAVVTIGEDGLDFDSEIWVTKTHFIEDPDNDLKDLTPIATSIYNENIHNAYTHDIFKDDTRKSYTHFFIENTLYYGKTWAHFVTSEPAGFALNNIDSKEDLAWLLSYVNGLNGSDPHENAQATLTANVNMKDHYWKPVGIVEKDGCEHGFTGTFDGQWHTIDGLVIKREGFHNIGFFDNVASDDTHHGLVKNVVLGSKDCEIHPWNPDPVAQYTGGLVGSVMEGGTVTACEAYPVLNAHDATNATVMGGVAGRVADGGLVHSCIGMPSLTGYTMGGIAGLVENGGHLVNSYTNLPAMTCLGTEFDSYIGGLVGRVMSGGVVENCYTRLQATATALNNFGWLVGDNAGSVSYCYTPKGVDRYVYNGTAPSGHGQFSFNPLDRKALGYLYYDDTLTVVGGSNSYRSEEITYANGRIDKFPGMFSALNQWVKEKNDISDVTSPYYHKNFTSWYRATTPMINNDLPILGFSDFSSVTNSTDENRIVLQYGGLDALLDSCNKVSDAATIFHYGSATNVEKTPNANVKVFINEDAVVIQKASTKADPDPFEATVGITFDNSWAKAHDYFENTLEYDWHLMSSSLSNAPMGTKYNMSANMFYTSPANIIALNYHDDDLDKDIKSYFPDGLSMHNDIEPYWDFYSYDEPDYHWINFKRSTGNHWHMDDIGGYEHPPIHFTEFQDFDHPYVNETVHIPGKGYMMAISQDSYLSNTGTLNQGTITIPLTAKAPANEVGEPTYDRGSNLVGNPYQAYLDLEEVSKGNTSLSGFYFYCADGDESAQGMYVPYTSRMSRNPIAPSRYIHPHQGFFVVTNNDVPMTFTPTMATDNKNDYSYFRNENIDYPVINLVVTDTLGNGDLAIVEVRRPELGGLHKINNLRNADFKLYAHLEGEDYGLLFAPEGTKRIPLFFKTPNNGTYNLSWKTHNGTFTSLILVDNLTGVHYDMLTHDHYVFDAAATDYASRFYIVFSVTDVEEYDDVVQPFAFFDGNGWVINGEGQLELIDVLGRVLQSTYQSGEQSRVYLHGYSQGTYMFRLIDNHGNTKVQKIVIYD